METKFNIIIKHIDTIKRTVKSPKPFKALSIMIN